MSSRRVVLSIVVGLLSLPATASAAPGWVAPLNFPVPSTDLSIGGLQGQDQVLYQNGGIATEAFLQVESISPVQTTLHVGTLAPGGSYSDQLTIASSEDSIPLSVQIAVAPNGAAVATWAEVAGSNVETSPLRYLAAYRPAGASTWEAPFTLATDSERGKEISEVLTPAIGTDGTAAVGVQHIASGEKGAEEGEPLYRIDVAVHHPGASWQTPTRLSAAGVSGERLALAVDANGNVTAAYTSRFSEGGTPKTEDDRFTAIVRRLPVSSDVWGPEENISGSDITHSVGALHLGENEAGDAVLAYEYGEVSKQVDVWGVTRQGPNGSWTAPTQLVTGGSNPEAAGVAPNGTAYILYFFQGASSGESCEGVLRGPAGGSFTAARCVSPTNEDTFSGSMAFLGNDAYFAWRGEVPGAKPPEETIQGARWADATTLPDVATNLDTPNLTYGFPTLVNDYQGSVVAFYTNPGGLLRAAAYDAGPPILVSARVPVIATAGQPVSFSASFFDLWAGLGAGQPVWSFGDGSAASSGASVVHTFATPGLYTLTLSAADAIGNATSTSYTISVYANQGTPALAGPRVTISQPRCRHRLSRKACKHYLASATPWRTLRGTVTAPAGLANVQVAVYRTEGKLIEGLVGKRFHKTTSAKARKTFTTAKVRGASWSLQLPKLGPGHYTILVRATDRAGHVSATVTKTLQLE